jgi:hypothetical protein
VTNPTAGEAFSPDAAVAPALASIFDFEFTSREGVTLRSALVCAALPVSHTRRENPSPNFLLRKQKLGVPPQNGRSPFGTVSSKSHWQALAFVPLEPFMVELFIAERLTRSPDQSIRYSLSPTNNSPRQPR